MYGECTATVVYGMCDNHTSDLYLSQRFLIKYFGDDVHDEEIIQTYATELVRWHAYWFVYGVKASSTKVDGRIVYTVSDEDRALIDKLAALFKMRFPNGNFTPCYMPVIGGDFLYGDHRKSFNLLTELRQYNILHPESPDGTSVAVTAAAAAPDDDDDDDDDDEGDA